METHVPGPLVDALALSHVRALSDHLTDGVLLLDRAGVVCDVNSAACAIFEATAEALVGRPAGAWVGLAPEASDRSAVVWPTADTVHGAPQELEARRGDGGLFRAYVTLVSLSDTAGQVAIVRPVGIARPRWGDAERALTQQQLLTRLLRLSLRPGGLTQLLEATLDVILATPWLPTVRKGGIFLCDGTRPELILTASRRLDAPLVSLCDRVPFGTCLCGRAALSGRLVAASCVDERHTTRFAGMAPHGHYVVPLVAGDTVHGVLVLYLAHGHTAAPAEIAFLDAVGRTLAGMIVRRKAEEELASATRALAARSADLETFALEISHDLQAPLRKVRSLGQRLRDRLKGHLDEDLTAALERMERTTGRMQQLIDGVLAYRVLGDTTRRRVALDDVLRAVQEDLPVPLEALGATLESDRLPVVSGTESQLHQLFANLISNALRYRRADVPLMIRIGARIFPGCADFQPRVVLSFEDNGRGFPADCAERIFEPFERLEPDHTSGSGIGLTTCHRIVLRHGGTIQAVPRDGGGACFHVTLPLDGEPVAAAREGPLAPALLADRLDVVIAEDDEDDAFFTERAVLGIATEARVERVADGQALLDHLAARRRRGRPPPDFVLLDLHMPVMDGRTVLHRMADEGDMAAVPVIVMADPSTGAHLLRDVQRRVVGFAPKPVDGRLLSHLVHASLADPLLEPIVAG